METLTIQLRTRSEHLLVGLREYLILLRARWVTVALITALGLALALATTALATPKYLATTRIFFAVQAGDSVSDLAQGSSFTEKQMSSYAQVATSPLVLEPVIDELALGLEAQELARSLRASVPVNTVILEVSSGSNDPEQAALIANAVGMQLAKTVADLSPERPDGTQAVRATTLSPATVPRYPSSPNVKQNAIVGLVLGLLLGAGAAVLRERLNTRVRSEKDLGEISSRAVLGAIPFDGAAARVTTGGEDPAGRMAESIRRLRTNLLFFDAGAATRTILLTSSVPNEGKTTIAINLAVALAHTGSRVVLLDADLRRPSVGRVTGLEPGVGLTTVLVGRARLADVIQPWGGAGVDVIAAGDVPPNPSELLGSVAMASVVSELARDYDYVLLDGAPILPVTDSVALSKTVSGTLVVVGADSVRRDELRSSLGALDAVEARVLGLVLNKIGTRRAGSYGYDYGYTALASVPQRRVRRGARRRSRKERGQRDVQLPEQGVTGKSPFR